MRSEYKEEYRFANDRTFNRIYLLKAYSLYVVHFMASLQVALSTKYKFFIRRNKKLIYFKWSQFSRSLFRQFKSS